ncbi:MAG: FG-GAP-like repeat-containing protein [Planctomycetota bacterium]
MKPAQVWVIVAFGFVATSFASDCNLNGVEDIEDVQSGQSEDCNGNHLPDECEIDFLRFGRTERELNLTRDAHFLVSVDMTKDGVLDFVAGTREGFVSVFRNDAERGELFPLGARTIPGSIEAVRVADLDSDGELDVFVVAVRSVHVCWGRGDGSIGSPETFPIIEPACDAFLEDIDGDGRTDVALVHDGRRSPRLTMYRGLGERLFAEPIPISDGEVPRGMTHGDFDSDGDVDVVVMTTGPFTAAIRWNESTPGTIQFSEPESLALEERPFALLTARLDDDDGDDLLILFRGQLISYVQREGGLANFETRWASITPSAFPRLHDINGDGHVDLVTRGSGGESLYAVLADGQGGFRAEHAIHTNFAAASFSLGDFDSDGATEIAIAGTGGTLAFFSQAVEAESVSFRVSQIAGGQRPHTLAIADFDGDGDTDLVTGDGHGGTITTYINGPIGTLSRRNSVSASGAVHTMGSADLDGDGDIDLVLGTFDNAVVRIWMNEGAATFRYAGGVNVTGNIWELKVRDIDGDGAPDILASTRAAGAVLRNDGKGRFTLAHSFPVRATSGTVLDYDNDGLMDVGFVALGGRLVYLIRQLPDFEFEAEGVRVGTTQVAQDLTSGDWDQDGRSDLALATGARSVTVIYNRGGGKFTTPQDISVDLPLYSIESGDVTGDGLLDLLVTSESANQVAVLVNEGTSFEILGRYTVGNGPRESAVADFDEDGHNDFITINRGSAGVTLHRAESSRNSDLDYLHLVCTAGDYRGLALTTRGDVRAADRHDVKYVVPARPVVDLLPATYQNTRRYRLHQDFLRQAFPERFPSLGPQAMIAMTQIRSTRDYFIGAVSRIQTKSGPLYTYSIVAGASPGEVLTVDEVRYVHGQISESFGLEPLAYAPDPSGDNPLAREAAESWVDPGFPIFFGAILVGTDYLPYTEGVTFGRLRVLDREAFDEANEEGRFTFQDVVITDHAPRDIEGVVGGVITSAPQGPLSHLAVRTARRGTPNAFVEQALLAFQDFEGELVRLEVRGEGYEVREATLREAEAFWAERPRLPEPRPFDADYRGLDDLASIAASDRPDDARFGGKSAGLARLYAALGPPFEVYRENGFVVPMSYYLEFLETTRVPSPIHGGLVSLEVYLGELFSDEDFLTDSQKRFEELELFRALAGGFGRVPESLVDGIRSRIIETFGNEDVPVRARSSSNVEDLLEFNGAGLYESTSACALDEFDDDNDGPSLCDEDIENERPITRALRRVWSSLWTFRAYEEHSFFQIPQESATMGVLFTPAIRDELANGVVFTGDPVRPRKGCYLVTVQVGDESVVRPGPDVLPEVNILEVDRGEVFGIVRAQRSSLLSAGEFVLDREQLRELGSVIWHIEENYAVETGEHDRDDVLLDLEFKIAADGSLRIKQARPFLIPGGRPAAPILQFVIPSGSSTCGTMNLNAPTGSLAAEYEAKSVLRFRPGTYEIEAGRCVVEANIVEELVVGPDRSVAVPVSSGFFRVESVGGPNGGYFVEYRQEFELRDGRRLDLRLLNVEFHPRLQRGRNREVVLTSDFITHEMSLFGFIDDPSMTITYGSCDFDTLPSWTVSAQFSDGNSLRIRERFLPPEDINRTGPAAAVAAEFFAGENRHFVTGYWNLVYASARHNVGASYWVLFDPAIIVPGIEDRVHVVEFNAPDPKDLDVGPPPQPGSATYLDHEFRVLATRDVGEFVRGETAEQPTPNFVRGDADADGSRNIRDAIGVFRFLFAGGDGFPCDKAADADGNGQINLSDGVAILNFLFRGQELVSPSAACGRAPRANTLPCDEFSSCF